MAAAILDVEHLTVCRDGTTVVEDVSFSLPPESDTALVGPNGAGKSSLVQALLGILPRRSGTIRLLGHALGARGQLPVAVRDRIAYLPRPSACGAASPSRWLNSWASASTVPAWRCPGVPVPAGRQRCAAPSSAPTAPTWPTG